MTRRVCFGSLRHSYIDLLMIDLIINSWWSGNHQVDDQTNHQLLMIGKLNENSRDSIRLIMFWGWDNTDDHSETHFLQTYQSRSPYRGILPITNTEHQDFIRVSIGVLGFANFKSCLCQRAIYFNHDSWYGNICPW